MKDLLERWAETEPNRCEIHTDGLYYSLNTFPNVLVIETRRWHLPIIQGAVQEAIEARDGLRWHIGLGGETINWWYAQIDKDGKVIGSWEAESSNSPAEALLTAYLSALEAQVPA